MEVDNCVENQQRPCRSDFVKPMSLVMDDHGSHPHPRSSGLRVSTKSKAPSPPGLKKLDSPGLSQWYPGTLHLTMDQKENLIDTDLSLVVVLPGGVEEMTTVHGSKPLMDLLVTLCAKYHLNPSSHTLELVTANKNNTKLKPNALIGTLDAEKIILKPKGQDKNKKTGPQMPEATVRMVINYKKTQKTILRVNPRVPLADHLPAICEKCEFDIETTVLWRDVQSLAPLDLSSSLNDYAIREVYARDTKGQPASPVCPASPTHAVTPGKDKNQKEKENKGLFSKFRKSKKKSNQATTASAPASPVLVNKPRPLSMALPSSNSSPLTSPTLSIDVPKKRRAPPPPIVVSQSCASDLSTRRRLHSEPTAQLDSDQMAGLSRGSSAESSLKRTKRKAPPPPTSPSAVVQETVPLDESLQGGAAANTLEEIMEQEETTASVMSATASDTQGEDCSLNTSADVSLHSPSPDTEIMATMSMEGNGEDQSCDLSSDGNQLQSTVNDSVTLSDVRTTDGMDSSELADTNSGPRPVENVSQHPICEESTPQNVEGDCSTVPSSLPPPVSQDADLQASLQANTVTLWEQTDRLESPVATSTSRPSGEDAQVQADFPPPPVPPQQHMEKNPPSANAPAFESAAKKDMATVMEEVNSPVLKHALPHTSETLSCQDSTPSAPATTKAPSIYATNSEPKPKPSNELTRDYIPKVGMTTYTIVPQKSLEKLRYFEVALILETPPEAPEGGLDIGSLQLEESTAPRGQTDVSKAKSELHSTIPREDLLTSTTTTQGTVNGSIPESIHSSSPTSSPKTDDKISSFANGASQAGSPAEVKEMKIPPATKPKPGSFRLAQHKKKPGHYVTSAAEKNLSASPGSGQREAQISAERANLPPPPFPPPVQCQEETTGAADVELSPKGDDKNVAFMQMTRQSSLPSKEPSIGLSLEKLRSFAAPRPYSPATPSRFAQAVSSAVRKSHSISHGPTSPNLPVSPHFSPSTSRSSVIESEGLSELKNGENRVVDGDKDSTLQLVEVEPPSFIGIAHIEGKSSP
ncbi:cordon-bleu protein-like 1b isoform X2 [Anarrhichthys ocellatus]|uniref:cordon-bleu protein-like 1b isoform X2 n=1 Tax=Anarrhichthys ocellatus TaxID=433405 RepID=UPI0012EE4FDA|nr:cordon-bleu protein-like 1 isoform X2 [Anarrhichthys ocellatus]